MDVPERARAGLQSETLRWFLVGLALSGGLSLWLSLGLDNDVHARLAREISHTPWLAQTNTKPFEQLIARMIGALHLDPLASWRVLGVMHLALLLAALIRLGRDLSGDAPRGALVAAAAATLLSPLVAGAFLTLNSVATCAAALLVWTIARIESRQGVALAALTVLALSRVDGAILSGGLVALEIALLPPERRREWFLQVAVVAGCAAIWLVLDRVNNGQWLGILDATERYMEAAGSAPRSVGQMLWWFIGAWVSNGGKLLTLFALLGAIGGLSGGNRPAWARLAGALAIHHAFLLLLGLTGKPFFYRFFVVDFVFGPLLAVLGALWLCKQAAARMERDLPDGVRWAAVALVLAGSLAGVSGLPAMAEHSRQTREQARAAAACLETGTHPLSPGELWAVPTRLHGALTYQYRNAPLADLTWLEDYRARGVTEARVLHAPESAPPARSKSIAQWPCQGALAGFVVDLYRTDPLQ